VGVCDREQNFADASLLQTPTDTCDLTSVPELRLALRRSSARSEYKASSRVRSPWSSLVFDMVSGGEPPRRATPSSSPSSPSRALADMSQDSTLPDGLLAWFDRMSVSGPAFSFRIDVNGATGVGSLKSDSEDEDQGTGGGPILAGLNAPAGKALLDPP
jgi:hypothetical protein